MSIKYLFFKYILQEIIGNYEGVKLESERYGMEEMGRLYYEDTWVVGL